MKTIKITIFSFLVFAMVNCIPTGNTDTSGSCLFLDGYCFDYVGTSYTPASAESTCANQGGAFSSTNCSALVTSGLCYGSCYAYPGAPNEIKVVFYPNYSQSAAEFVCFLYGNPVSDSCP